MSETIGHKAANLYASHRESAGELENNYTAFKKAHEDSARTVYAKNNAPFDIPYDVFKEIEREGAVTATAIKKRNSTEIYRASLSLYWDVIVRAEHHFKDNEAAYIEMAKADAAREGVYINLGSISINKAIGKEMEAA
jgi:hypothetical protein